MPIRKPGIARIPDHLRTAMGNLAGAKRLAAENQTRLFRARIAFYEGDWKATRETMQQVVDWARRGGAKWEELNVLAYVVELLRVIGDYDGAAAALKRAWSLYPPDDQFWEIRLTPHGVMLCFDAGWNEEAGRAPGVLPQDTRTRGGLAGYSGSCLARGSDCGCYTRRLQESDRHFEKAMEIFRQYSMSLDGSRDAALLGTSAPARGPGGSRERETGCRNQNISRAWCRAVLD